MTEIGLSVIDLPTVCCSTVQRWREKEQEQLWGGVLEQTGSIPHLANHRHPRQTSDLFQELERIKNGLEWTKMDLKLENYRGGRTAL